MQISDNNVASINYTLKNDQGEVLDSSEGAAPLDYIHGTGNLIPGLESELAGKSSGDKFSVSLAPESAYGPVIDEMIQTVPREAFAGIEDIQEGMQFQAETAAGPQPVVITRVEGDQVTVDGNHPMAGLTLHFEVEVIEVREATADELEHGHVHGEGCQH